MGKGRVAPAATRPLRKRRRRERVGGWGGARTRPVAVSMQATYDGPPGRGIGANPRAVGGPWGVRVGASVPHPLELVAGPTAADAGPVAAAPHPGGGHASSRSRTPVRTGAGAAAPRTRQATSSPSWTWPWPAGRTSWPRNTKPRRPRPDGLGAQAGGGVGAVPSRAGTSTARVSGHSSWPADHPPSASTGTSASSATSPSGVASGPSWVTT